MCGSQRDGNPDHLWSEADTNDAPATAFSKSKVAMESKVPSIVFAPIQLLQPIVIDLIHLLELIVLAPIHLLEPNVFAHIHLLDVRRYRLAPEVGGVAAASREEGTSSNVLRTFT